MDQSIVHGMAVLYDTHIIEIAPQVQFDLKKYQVFDCQENYLSPGFIDVHIHGSNGADVMDASQDALDTISKSLCTSGVTSYLATTMTMPLAQIEAALSAARQYAKSPMPYAQVLGVHLEGPYINETYKGAQNPEFIIEPNIDWIRNYYDIVKLMTLAPELPNAMAFIETVKKESDMILSIGHSDATFKHCCEAHAKGASHITHLFNAMKPLHHREPGVVGAALSLDFTCEVILDKVHFSEDLFDLIYKIKGPHKMIAVTDSIRAGCLKPGLYELGGQKVIVDHNSARLESGQLAGSILTLNQAIKHFMEHTNLDMPSAVALVTENPADLLKLTDRGRLELGKRADFTIFDRNMTIGSTIIGGVMVFSKE
jgi:N-acetylglucosamine-6-phosphate deacetylase